MRTLMTSSALSSSGSTASAAKEWLEKSQLQPAPQTPTQTIIRCDGLDRSATADVNGRDSLTLSLETLKAKRKQVAIDIVEHHGDDDLHDWTLNSSERSSQTIVAQGNLPKKVAKASTLVHS